jgi:hypothetical protein
MVHPSMWVKSMLWFLTPFVSKTSWRKLIYINRLTQLYQYFDAATLTLPEHSYR